MTATADQIARLRRMINEGETSTTYTEAVLREMLESYPLIDQAGYSPTYRDGTQNTDWTPTYDLNAAAADVWAEKAAALATQYDFATENQGFRRSQAYQAALQSSRYYNSRRAIKTIRQQPEPKPPVNVDEDNAL